MLVTICATLIVLWLVGMATSNTMGGLVHVLLVAALAVMLARVVQDRSPV
jgi:Family of unknown function (DUF5670)